MIAAGFRLWRPAEYTALHVLHLPESVRNIPTKNCLSNLVLVTRDSR